MVTPCPAHDKHGVDPTRAPRQNDGMSTRARAPLRIDLAGGWTDVPAFADAEAARVVNVTIKKYVRATLGDDGSRRVRARLRAGGLGSSACEHVLAAALRDPDADLDDIAEAAFAAETADGVAGGRQDQYAACYGGLNFMTFAAANRGRAARCASSRSELPEAHLASACRSGWCLSIAASRGCRARSTRRVGAYARHEDAVTGALLALQAVRQGAMRDAIAGSDFGGIRHVLNENWTQQKRLHASVTNDDRDHLRTGIAAGASAGKACGAGGGGALVFYASSDGDAITLRRTLAAEGLAIIPCGFSSGGLEDE